MSLLVVGSIALDSVATPFGETADAPGGSAVFFAAARARRLGTDTSGVCPVAP